MVRGSIAVVRGSMAVDRGSAAVVGGRPQVCHVFSEAPKLLVVVGFAVEIGSRVGTSLAADGGGVAGGCAAGAAAVATSLTVDGGSAAGNQRSGGRCHAQPWGDAAGLRLVVVDGVAAIVVAETLGAGTGGVMGRHVD
jgi:hypothetical protein